MEPVPAGTYAEVDPNGEVADANGLLGESEENGLAHGSGDEGSFEVHVGRVGNADWDKRLEKSASSSILSIV